MIERHDDAGLRTLTLAHKKANALDLELFEAVGRELAAARDDAVDALVLTGRGTIFSAGVDLFRLLDEDRDYLDRFLPALDRLLAGLLEFPGPVVAALNGHAIAGGLVMALACDRRLMAEGRGRVGVPELLVGVPFPALPLEVVRAKAAPAQFEEMVLTGRTYTAQEALERGLVDELAPPEELAARAAAAARQMAGIPRRSFALAKQQLHEPLFARAERLAHRWDAEVLELWADEEVRATIRDYLDRTVG